MGRAFDLLGSLGVLRLLQLPFGFQRLRGRLVGTVDTLYLGFLELDPSESDIQPNNTALIVHDKTLDLGAVLQMNSIRPGLAAHQNRENH